MAHNNEGKIQTDIHDYIIGKGGWVINESGSMTKRPGIPDLLACYKGRFLGIEVKTPSGVVSKAQGINCRAIQRAGGLTLAPRSLDDVKRWFKSIDMNEEFIEGEFDDGTRY